MNKQEENRMAKLERGFSVLLLALIVLAPTAAYVGYQYAVHSGAITSPGTTYGPGDVDTASYTIFQEAGTYYAKNGLTRVIDYSGTDASTVVSDVLDAMIASTSGEFRYLGTLHFGKGILSFNTLVTKEVPVGVTACYGPIIEGEGRYTTALRAIGAHGVFSFNGTARDNRFEAITIRNLEISSDAGSRTATKHLLTFYWATFVMIYDCYIYNSYDSGIFSDSNMEGIWIYSNGIYGNHGCGIEIRDDGEVHIWDNNIAYNGQTGSLDGIVLSSCSNAEVSGNDVFYSGRYGIFLYSAYRVALSDNHVGISQRDGIALQLSDNNTITGGTVFENSNETTDTYDGIVLGESNFNIISGVRVFDEAVAAPRQCWGIREEGTSDYNIFIGDSTIMGGLTGGIAIVGANTEVHSCYNGTSWIV